MRPFVAAALMLVLAAGCGGKKQASAPPPSTAAPPTSAPKAHASPLRVTLTAQSHTPRVGKPWHYVVRVTDAAGRPVRAKVHVQILFGGAPVGQIGTHIVTGVWQETIGQGANQPFPAESRGYPLVFEAVVTAKGVTVKRNWPIRVR